MRGDNATRAHRQRSHPARLLFLDAGEGEVAEDQSGEHEGTLENTEWVKGKYGSAIYLDGNDDYVEIPDSPELQLTEEFTLETWVRPEGVHDEGVAISKEAGNFYSYQLFAGSRKKPAARSLHRYEPWTGRLEDEKNLQAKTWKQPCPPKTAQPESYSTAAGRSAASLPAPPAKVH